MHLPGMIRAAQPADAAAIAALIRTCFAAVAARLDPPPSALRESAASVADQIAAGGGAVWDEAGIRGCVLWRPDGDALYTGRLAVAPEWQRRGIALALLAEAEREAGRRRLARLTLAVRLVLEGNRRLFARAGFHETTQEAHPGFASPTFVNAEKRLGDRGGRE